MKAAIVALCFVCVVNLGSTQDQADTKQDPEWWKKTVVYQIYPRSFQDSDGDGVGDLKGIQSRLDYIKYLGADTIWLSPVYSSPFKDFGYDISDHKDIDPVFGTLQDFDELLEEVHSKGMYLIMDFIPNHTSDLHPWFIESRRSKDNDYSDFYRWEDGQRQDDGTMAPPNNWLSVFGHSAWEWCEERQQFYLHQFLVEQPDLNYRNPAVRRQMEDVLRFWTLRGVDGFRVDAIQTMFEVDDVTRNEPPSFIAGATPEEHKYLIHKYTQDQPEIHEVVQEWRTNVFDPIDAQTGKHTYMVMEVYDPTLVESMKYYHSGADMPFNFNLISINQTCGGNCVRGLVDSWIAAMPEDKWLGFVLGNHDNRRITTRKGAAYSNALNMMLLLLPGTPTTYYGEELGMLDIEVSFEDTQDPWGKSFGPDLVQLYSRDPERAPMQWSDDVNAGFSTAEKTWLPLHPDYVTRNVEAQMSNLLSSLQCYRKAASLRNEPAFISNSLEYDIVDDNVLSFMRSAENQKSYMVILNLGDDVSANTYSANGPSLGFVTITTSNFGDDQFQEGSLVDFDMPLSLEPGQGLVIELIEAKFESKDEL